MQRKCSFSFWLQSPKGEAHLHRTGILVQVQHTSPGSVLSLLNEFLGVPESESYRDHHLIHSNLFLTLKVWVH